MSHIWKKGETQRQEERTLKLSMKDDLTGAVSTCDSKGEEIQLKYETKHNANTFYTTLCASSFFSPIYYNKPLEDGGGGALLPVTRWRNCDETKLHSRPQWLVVFSLWTSHHKWPKCAHLCLPYNLPEGSMEDPHWRASMLHALVCLCGRKDPKVSI